MSLRIVFVLLLALSGVLPAAASGLPVVYIATADGEPVLSREEWRERVSVRVVMPDGSVAYETGRAAVRCRGHSTYDKPKKPYALRLPRDEALLGMPAGRRWVLLANFMDHSLLRNRLALEMARQTGLAWTPEYRMVDVVVNGRAMGCYSLCQQIRVGRGKVDTPAHGGFLLELDRYAGGAGSFTTCVRRLPVHVKYPKEPTALELRRIRRRLDKVERMLYEEGGSLERLFREQLDLPSFADWFIVHELAQNAEPNGPRSCYLYKGRDGLLRAGPVWDFDLAFISVGLDAGGDLRPLRLGRTDVRTLTGDSLYNVGAWWFDRLWRDSLFRSRVAERWAELRPRFEALAGRIGEWGREVRRSAEADEALWGGQDPARFDDSPSFEASVANLRRVYVYRLRRLDALLAE